MGVERNQIEKTALTGMSGSVSVALTQYLEKGLDQDLDIEPKAPIVDVPKIEFYALGDGLHGGRGAPGAIALRPPRQPWLDMMPESIVFEDFLEIAVMGKGMR